MFILPGLLSLVGLTAATIYNTRFNKTTWDDNNWIITTKNLSQHRYQSRMSLANGYLGINLAAVGPFFDVDAIVDNDTIQGWPLFDRRQSFATIAGFWDSQPTTNGSNFVWLNQYGGESVISGIPHWAGLYVQAEDQVLNANVPESQISNFSSSVDYRNAVMHWKYTWTPTDGTVIGVEYSMFVHKLHVNQAAVQLQLNASRNVNVTVLDVLDGDCAVRTTAGGQGHLANTSTIWTSVSPNGLENVTAFVYSTLTGDTSLQAATVEPVSNPALIGTNSSSIGQSAVVTLGKNRTSTVVKYIGVASSDAFEDPQSTAKSGSQSAASVGFSSLLTSHSAEWRSVMPQDSVDNFRDKDGSLPFDADIQEFQITAITNPFQLLQNTVGNNAVVAAGNNEKLQANSISVCGLGSSCYAGLIFWDTEVWMQPGLVVSHPQDARQIAQYRVDRFEQAKANIHTAYQSSQNVTGKFSDAGAIFPWTSGRFGNCTGTGPCFDYEYHINGDIALQLWNYWSVTGNTDYFRNELFPIYEAVAQTYADLVTFNVSTGQYDLYNATDPDEYANYQNNTGFTMVLMSGHINDTNSLRERFGMEPNETWTNISSLIKIPVNNDAGIILEYETQNGSITVKQADIILIDDFLQYENRYTLSDLDYYASAQSQDGPAMTYGAFSIVANRESPSGCSSYTYDLYGSQPYTRGPWFQFSEQLNDNASANGGTHPAYPFLTGVGGANRVAVFGYLGLRLNPDTLDIDPSLPPQIPQLQYRTIYWQGWPIKARSNQTHTTLRREGTALPTANGTFQTAPIPVIKSLTGTTVYELPPNGSVLTIENRQIGLNKTIDGNILQCMPAWSDNATEPGQFPLSAVDGASSTKWVPLHANAPSSMTVHLPQPFVPVTAVRFDWAQAPPVGYRVLLHNLSDTTAIEPVVLTEDEDVRISDPFDVAEEYLVKPYASNTTNVTLPGPVWSARFATLEVWGNQQDRRENATGASVAEWALVSGSEEKLIVQGG